MTTMTPFSDAEWIAGAPIGGTRVMPPVPYLRRAFDLPASKAVKSATLTITALGLYEAEINGQRVGDQFFAPGWTDYKKRVQYQEYDVAALLTPGKNVVGVVLGDGWYCGHVAWSERQRYGEKPQLLARLLVTFADGSTQDIVTDQMWKFSTGPLLESDIMMGETYDARLELPGWSKAGYNDQTWLPVVKGAPTSALLVKPPGPPVRAIEELPVAKEWFLHNGPIRIYDFAQNFTGVVRVTVEAPRGTTLKLRFAEILDEKGNLYVENLRAARCTDFYTCKGEGVETYQPRFTFHGFRYLEIQGLPKDAKVTATGVVLHSDTKPTGHFACSNPLLNQLQHNIIWGQKSNFLDVPTDCPQRDERMGWTGDAQVFIRTAAFNMDVQGFFHKWMQDVRDAQREDGGIPCVVPAGNAGLDFDGGPAWADATIICPWTIYRCYADKKILEDHYESMEKYMDYMLNLRCQDFIRGKTDSDKWGTIEWGGFGDWLAMDGSGVTEGITPKDLIGTAFHAYDCELMVEVATVLGKPADAAKYQDLHEKIKTAFQRRFITPDGLMAAGTQTAYVLALHFGLVPEEARETTARELVKLIEKKGNHIGTGFVGTPYILDVLENTGHLDVAYQLLEQETFPSWIFPIKNGATTIWERWDGWTPEKGFQDKGMNSFNHYAYGAVGAWMTRRVAGLSIDPKKVGYEHIQFKPRPGGTITWAEASLETVRGKASIRWELAGDALKVELEVPATSTATLEPPAGYGTATEYGAGKHTVTLVKAA